MRMIRPDAEKYLVGNEDNGFICYKPVLEEWEKKYPCYFCPISICKSYSDRPCQEYDNWLKLNPLRRIRKIGG